MISCVHSDEWENFLERLGNENADDMSEDVNDEDLRDWASFRGQTLSRTGEFFNQISRMKLVVLADV